MLEKARSVIQFTLVYCSPFCNVQYFYNSILLWHISGWMQIHLYAGRKITDVSCAVALILFYYFFLSRQVSDFTAKKRSKLMRLLSHSDLEMCVYIRQSETKNNNQFSFAVTRGCVQFKSMIQ